MGLRYGSSFTPVDVISYGNKIIEALETEGWVSRSSLMPETYLSTFMNDRMKDMNVKHW